MWAVTGRQHLADRKASPPERDSEPMILVECKLETPILAATLAENSAFTLTYEDERLLPDGRIRFLFWASGGEFDDFDDGLDADPTVENRAVLGVDGSKRLYRVELADPVDEMTVYQAYTEVDAVPIDATGTVDGWNVKMQFPGRANFKQFRRQLLESGVSVELFTIFTTRPNDQNTPRSLTQCQEDALVTALEDGYFSIPRETSLADLASELGVSSQAASERLRRGTEQLVRHTLTDQP
ncbi:helix-turn-helix domain-containing protein [Haladaptatus sp. GCM10025707]|uniref:helix-turn-helix domain-containing protein n=1 Tax=unclassified Haladaptatus TaxID=2622732 RepID=UPI0023E8BF7F|nr:MULTISPECIES: helix-turn-helix domain-containing protein [unclassified Haladaptatus]